MGEPAFAPVAAAIANAVADAIGVRVFDLPITPEKVVHALEGRRSAYSDEAVRGSDR
jgi:CO/xanthine dehydrogenase Mo-binding subunit